MTDVIHLSTDELVKAINDDYAVILVLKEPISHVPLL